MNAILYARVSTDDQIEKYGIPSQYRACREYAQRNGYTVVCEIADEGISGATMERPGLDRVRRMAKNGEFDVLVMFDADRLSRELAHLLILKPELEKNVRMEFVAAKFEDSPSGRMFFNMRGVIAQYEREAIRERTTRGRRERAREGYWHGRTPLGYDYIDGLLKPNQYADTVRRIFSLYAGGASLREIARRLRADNVPTYIDGSHWWYTSVRAVLKNDTYTGVGSHGEIVVPAPAIIEQALYDRCQQRLEQNINAGRPSGRYLLRGMLWCACGRKMNGDTSNGRGRYVCRDLRTSQRHLQIGSAVLETAVYEKAVEMTTNGLPELIERHIKALQAEHGGRGLDLRNAIERARKQETRANEELLRADDDQREWWRGKAREAAAERRRLQAEMATIEDTDELTRMIADGSIEELASELSEVVKVVDRREFLSRAIHRLEWDGEGVKVFIFMPEMFGCSCKPLLFTRPLRAVALTSKPLILQSYARVAA